MAVNGTSNMRGTAIRSGEDRRPGAEGRIRGNLDVPGLTILFLWSLVVLPGCGPSGVTLLKPSNLVDYQYVTCFPHKDDPGALAACIRYYEERGFVRQDQVNVLQM